VSSTIQPRVRQRRKTAIEAEAKTGQILQETSNEASIEVDEEDDDNNESDESLDSGGGSKSDRKQSKLVEVHPCGVIIHRLIIKLESDENLGQQRVIAGGSNVSIRNQNEILPLLDIVGKLHVLIEEIGGGGPK